MKFNTKIKVVGVGGSGGNALSRMMRCKIRGVDLIAINADKQDLQRTKAHQKVRIGKKLTKGLGTGMNPEIGRKAAEEQREDIKEVLFNDDVLKKQILGVIKNKEKQILGKTLGSLVEKKTSEEKIDAELKTLLGLNKPDGKVINRLNLD